MPKYHLLKVKRRGGLMSLSILFNTMKAFGVLTQVNSENFSPKLGE